MSQLWRTSKWARIHDWEWDEEDDRRALFPGRFLYHVLRLGQIEVDGLRDYRGSVDFLDHHPVLQEILNRFRTPAAFPDMGDSEDAAACDALRQKGLLVPADADEPVDYTEVFHSAVLLFRIQQLEDEFVPALEVVGALEPKTVLEIGTASGGSLFSWAQIAHPEARLVSLDLLGGPGKAGYTREYARRLRQFCAPGQSLSCILGRSQSRYIVRQVRSQLDPESVDLLYIDADHTYEAVKLDFDNFSPLVRPGGLIVFHDVCHPDNHPDCAPPGGVDRFWNEVKQDYEHREIVHNEENGAHYGIGILYR